MRRAGIRTSRSGFTVVELLIVIVVIAILAAITTVTYTGVQNRARDSARKQDIATLVKATQLYYVDNGDYAQAGCGMDAVGYEGSGWLHSDYDGVGPLTSINNCLTAEGHLSAIVRDPSGQNTCNSAGRCGYLKASCASGTWYFASLDTLPIDSTFTDDKCQSAWDTLYGVNYGVKVD